MTYGNLNILPYNSCNTNELKIINSNDKICHQNESVSKQQDTNNLKASNLCDEDLELKLTNLNDCKYYTVEEFQKMKNDNKF